MVQTENSSRQKKRRTGMPVDLQLPAAHTNHDLLLVALAEELEGMGNGWLSQR